MIDLEAETQEPTRDTSVTQEPIVEAYVSQEEEVRVDPKESTDEVAITQEPTFKVEQLESQDVVTPLLMLHVREHEILKEDGVQKFFC